MKEVEEMEGAKVVRCAGADEGKEGNVEELRMLLRAPSAV